MIGVEEAAEVTENPIRRRFRRGAQPHHLLEVLGHRLRGCEHRGVVGGEAEIRDQTLASRRRQLWQLGSDFGHPLAADLEGRQVGLGEVAIVSGELLGALRDRQGAGIIPTARFLDQPAARLQDFRLTFDLVLDRAVNRPEGVHVLDLDLGAELSLAHGPERHIGVAAKLA